MKARARTALGTLALLGAAVLALVWAGREEKAVEAEQVEKQKAERIFAFEPKDVKEVRVAAKGESARAVRDGDGWKLVAPREAPADRGVVDALVEKVATLRRTAEAAPADDPKLARFGLEAPRARVEVTLADGRTEALALGDDNAFDGSVFVRAGAGPVLVAEGGARWAIEKTPFDLRDKRVLPLGEGDVARLSVSLPDRRTRYGLRRDGDRWLVTAPFEGPADPDTAARVAGALGSLRAAGFAPVPGRSAVRWPPAEVHLTLKDGTARALLVAERKEGGGALAWLDGASEAAVLGDSPLAALAASPFDLRDKAVVRFDRSHVAAIRVDGPDGGYELRKKDGDAWALTAPKAADADPARAGRILWTLEGLRATRFVDEAGKALAAHGLEKPARSVTLVGADGKELARLDVGSASGDEVFVRSSGGPRIVAVPRAQIDAIPSKPEALEQKPGEAPGGKQG